MQSGHTSAQFTWTWTASCALDHEPEPYHLSWCQHCCFKECLAWRTHLLFALQMKWPLALANLWCIMHVLVLGLGLKKGLYTTKYFQTTRPWYVEVDGPSGWSAWDRILCHPVRHSLTLQSFLSPCRFVGQLTIDGTISCMGLRQTCLLLNLVMGVQYLTLPHLLLFTAWNQSTSHSCSVVLLLVCSIVDT